MPTLKGFRKVPPALLAPRAKLEASLLPLRNSTILPSMKWIGLLTICALLGACAMGNRYDYASVRATVAPPVKSSAVAVATIDRREYLLRGEIEDSYVGMTRGGFGNPFRVFTRSKAPLSEDLSAAVAGSLRDAGVKAQTVTSFSVTSRDSAISRLKAYGASKLVLITIREWESDTLIRTELTASVTVEVLSPSGQVLASDSFEGRRSLGGDILNPVLHARKTVLAETSKILGSLISSPKIAAALRGSTG